MTRVGAIADNPSVASPAPTFDPRALRPAILGVVVTVVTARITATILLNGFDAPTEVYVVCFYAIVFGGLWLTCVEVSRGYGTGQPFRDFGFAWRPADLWRGWLVFLMARVAQFVVILPWSGHLDRLRRLTEGLESVSIATFVIFSIIAVVVAPIFEELVFRGMLLRSLNAQAGPIAAIGTQAILFGMYHITPGLGSTNVPYVVTLSAAGAAFGWAANRWERLGPGATAHFFLNASSVALLYSAR